MEARRSSLSPVVPRSFSVLYPSHRETKKRHTIADRSLTDALALTTPSKKLDAELVDFGSPLTRKTKSPSFNDEDFKQLLKSPLGSSTKIKSMDSDLEELYRVRPQTSRTVRDSELFELDDDIIPVPSSDQPQEFQVQHFRKEDLVTFDYEEPTNEIKAEDLGEKLDLIERLSHPRWQVRRKVYSEIADSFRAGYFMMKVETSMNVFDYFEHKLKDIVSDTNITSQLEGLQTILTYTKCTPQIKQSVYFLGDELIPKCALTKQKSGEIVNQILTNMLERDSDLLLFHQIIKRFTAKNHKEACFSISCIKNALSIFPSTINIGKSIYSSTKKALSHSISEVRNEATNLLKEFFSYVYDSEEVFISKLDLKPQQIKEIKESLSIISKKEIKWVLFEDLKKPDENMLIYETENFENLKIDLISLAPQGFFETPYSNDIKSKKEIIGRFIQEIEKPVVFEIKDYSTVVNTLLHLVENTNSLVYIESMKAIEVLVLKLPKSFAYKGRHYVQFLVDKYKEKKKNVTLQINNILHLFRVHEVLPSLTIVDLLVEIAVNHKVPTVRELSLLWICEELNTHQKKNVDLLSGEYSDTAPWYSGNLENMIETIGKKVSLISKNDIVSTVRDAGIRLLGIFKSLSTGTSTSKYIDNLISKLPKRRIIEIDEKTRKSSKSRSPSPLPKLEYHKLDQDIIRNSSRSRSPSPSPIQKPDYQKLELDLAEISRSNTHEEPPKSFRKDLEGILGMIKEGDSHFKLEGLARFIRLVED